MPVTGDPRRWLIRPTNLLALLGMVGLVAMAFLQLADVAMRGLFNMPIRATENLMDVTIPIVIASCLPMGLAHGQDVAIRFLGQWLGRRADDWLEITAMLLTLIFYCLLSWQIGVYADELARGGRLTEVIRLPLAPTWWVVSAILAFSALVQLFVIVARMRHWGTGAFHHLDVDVVSTDMVLVEQPATRRGRDG